MISNDQWKYVMKKLNYIRTARLSQGCWIENLQAAWACFCCTCSCLNFCKVLSKFIKHTRTDTHHHRQDQSPPSSIPLVWNSAVWSGSWLQRSREAHREGAGYRVQRDQWMGPIAMSDCGKLIGSSKCHQISMASLDVFSKKPAKRWNMFLGFLTGRVSIWVDPLISYYF